MAEIALAAALFFHACQDLAEGGFACAIHADDGDAISLADFKAEGLQDVANAIVGFGNTFQSHHRLAARGRLRETETDLVVFKLKLNALDFIKGLHTALHHGRLVGLSPKAVDELLGLRDFLILILLLTLQLLAAGFALADEKAVVTLIKLNLAAGLEGQCAIGQVVEEATVMANEQDRAWIRAEVFFQPDHGLDVQVVRRFIQKQHGWLLKKQLGQGDAHLPATTELVRKAIHVLLGKAEAHQHAFDPRLHSGEIVMLKADLEIAKSFQGFIILRCARLKVTERFTDFLKLLLKLHGISEGGLAFSHQRAAFDLNALLRQLTNLDALRLIDAAFVNLGESCNDLHQSALPGSVRPSQSDALTSAHREV